MNSAQDETFLGYCFFDNGKLFAPPVTLKTVPQAVRYFELQKPLQHRVIITDEGDSIVAEAIEGKATFPKPQ